MNSTEQLHEMIMTNKLRVFTWQTLLQTCFSPAGIYLLNANNKNTDFLQISFELFTNFSELFRFSRLQTPITLKHEK